MVNPSALIIFARYQYTHIVSLTLAHRSFSTLYRFPSYTLQTHSFATVEPHQSDAASQLIVVYRLKSPVGSNKLAKRIIKIYYFSFSFYTNRVYYSHKSWVFSHLVFRVEAKSPGPVTHELHIPTCYYITIVIIYRDATPDKRELRHMYGKKCKLRPVFFK